MQNNKKNQDTEEEVYFNFINSLKSEVTKKEYEREIRLFMKFCDVANLSDLVSITEPQKLTIKYIMSIKERGLSYNSVSLAQTPCDVWIMLGKTKLFMTSRTIDFFLHKQFLPLWFVVIKVIFKFIYIKKMLVIVINYPTNIVISMYSFSIHKEKQYN